MTRNPNFGEKVIASHEAIDRCSGLPSEAMTFIDVRNGIIKARILEKEYFLNINDMIILDQSKELYSEIF